MPRTASYADLLHAEAGWLLDRAGVRSLVIKGPSIAAHFYAPGVRDYTDADVLVAPTTASAAVHILHDAGFTSAYAGTAPGEVARHSVVLRRELHASNPREVDLHDRFPGLDEDPSTAWEVLWERRVPLCVAGRDLHGLDRVSCALVGVVNAARDPSIHTLQDLERILQCLHDQEWQDLRTLAVRLHAEPALRAGLDLSSEGRDVAQRLALPAMDAEWRLRSAGASGPTLTMTLLLTLRGRQRLHLLRRELLPTRAFMQIDWLPRGRTGRLELAIAHVRRWKNLVGKMPQVLAQLRAQRRQRRTTGTGDSALVARIAAVRSTRGRNSSSARGRRSRRFLAQHRFGSGGTGQRAAADHGGALRAQEAQEAPTGTFEERSACES